MAIYDCFQFFNEENILDLRLNILAEEVDFFVIVESTTDHQGNTKKLNFDKTKFKKFEKKIIYIVVEDTADGIKKPHLGQNSLVERHQRNSIIRGLKNCADEDLVIISDVDEIPDLSKLNLLDKARQIINLGLAIDGQHVPCWIALGDVNLKLDNRRRALQCYDEAVKAQDVLSRSRMRDLDWIEKGKILEKAGVVHEGIRQYTNAVTVASETSRPYFRKANILIDYDKKEEARDIIQKGLEIDPESITGHRLLLQVMNSKEVHDGLRSVFSNFRNNKEISSLIGYKLATEYPELALNFLSDNNFEDLITKIECLKNLKRDDEALTVSKDAIDLYPNKIDGWISAGWFSYKMNNYSDANSYFEAALGCDISNPDALVGKALVLKAQNKDFSYYNRALEAIDPELVI